MISSMRSMAPKIMLIVLLAFLGTIFLDWGMNRGSATSRMTAAGKINGREVPLAYFDQQVNQRRQQLEREAPEQVERTRLIPQQIWEQEIQVSLLKDVIKSFSLYASVDEIFDFLKHNPIGGVDTAAQFKTNGVFDTNKYIALLNNPKLYQDNPEIVQFEKNYREFMLPVQKIETFLSATGAPSRAEAEYLYRARNEKAVFEYAFVKKNPAMTESAKVTPEMITRYYTAHKDSFKCENQADIYYIRISKAPTAQDEQKAYAEILTARDKIMASPNRLEAFIEENGLWNDDDVTSANGAELGWVSRGAQGPVFDSIAFGLEPGTVSAPIKTYMAHELIFVEKKEKDDKGEKVLARRIIRKISADLDSLAEKADSLRRLMQDVGFVKAAKEASVNDQVVSFDSTGLFEKNALVPGIGYLPGLGRFVWGPESKEADAISERLESRDGYYLLAIKSRVAKGTLPLETARPAITRILTDSIVKIKVRAEAEALLKKTGEATPLATLSSTGSGEIISGITDTITQLSYIPGIGQNTPVAAVAFTLPEGKRSGLIEHNGNFYIIRTLWKGPKVTISWESPDVAQLMGQMMSETKGKIFEKWYLESKKNMKIVSNIDKIYLD